MGSQFGKYVGGTEINLPPDKRWMKTLAHNLIQVFPDANFQVVLDFITSLPEDQRGLVAKELLETIETHPHGVLRAKDQEGALMDCIDEVKRKHLKAETVQ